MTQNKEPKSNYMKAGRMIECGACHPEKFESCEKLEKEFPTIKCDCICHDKKDSVPTLSPEENKEFNEKFSLIGEPSEQPSGTIREVKSFIAKIARKREEKMVEEIVEELERFWQNNYGMDKQGREFIYKKQFDVLKSKLQELKGRGERAK